MAAADLVLRVNVLNKGISDQALINHPYEHVTGKGPTWLFDLDYLTDSINYQPVRSENQANKHAGPQEANHNAGTKDNIDAGEAPTKHPDLQIDENPVDKEDQFFLDELERLKRQEKDANDAAVTPHPGENARRKQEWISSQHTVSI
ncbi:hypothetical protein Tco_1328031 [Tanacetum coccineum]